MSDDIVSLIKAIESIPGRICIGINSTLSVIEGVDNSIDNLNSTIEIYSKSTEKLSRNTFLAECCDSCICIDMSNQSLIGYISLFFYQNLKLSIL